MCAHTKLSCVRWVQMNKISSKRMQLNCKLVSDSFINVSPSPRRRSKTLNARRSLSHTPSTIPPKSLFYLPQSLLKSFLKIHNTTKLNRQIEIPVSKVSLLFRISFRNFPEIFRVQVPLGSGYTRLRRGVLSLPRTSFSQGWMGCNLHPLFRERNEFPQPLSFAQPQTLLFFSTASKRIAGRNRSEGPQTNFIGERREVASALVDTRKVARPKLSHLVLLE